MICLLQDRTSRLLSVTYPKWWHGCPNPSGSCQQVEQCLTKRDQVPFAQQWQQQVKCCHAKTFLETTQVLGSASHRWAPSLWYGVSASGVSGSNDTKKYNRKYKIFLNRCFTQQSIERGYEVWLTVIFIHLMDFSTLQLGSIPTGRRLFSSVKIINNSYAAVSAICGSSADCLDLLTSLLVGFF